MTKLSDQDLKPVLYHGEAWLGTCRQVLIEFWSPSDRHAGNVMQNIMITLGLAYNTMSITPKHEQPQ